MFWIGLLLMLASFAIIFAVAYAIGGWSEVQLILIFCGMGFVAFMLILGSLMMINSLQDPSAKSTPVVAEKPAE